MANKTYESAELQVKILNEEITNVTEITIDNYFHGMWLVRLWDEAHVLDFYYHTRLAVDFDVVKLAQLFGPGIKVVS